MIIQRNALGSGGASCPLCRGRSLPPLHYLDRPHSRAKQDVNRLDRPRAVVRLQPARIGLAFNSRDGARASGREVLDLSRLLSRPHCQ